MKLEAKSSQQSQSLDVDVLCGKTQDVEPGSHPPLGNSGGPRYFLSASQLYSSNRKHVLFNTSPSWWPGYLLSAYMLASSFTSQPGIGHLSRDALIAFVKQVHVLYKYKICTLVLQVHFFQHISLQSESPAMFYRRSAKSRVRCS